jgi:amicyanin
MKKWIALLLACLALGLVFAGCGDDDDDGGGSNDTQQPAGEGEGGVQESGEPETTGSGAQVGMASIQFEPAEIEVNAGDPITFTNNEAVPHDVHKTSGPGADFKSPGGVGGMQEGDTFELTLDEAGTYEYVCKVHAPGMAGQIMVK